MEGKIYQRDPLFYRDNIPVFSNSCEYTENYKNIAREELSSIQKTGHNPWIQEDLWQELEDSTAILIKKYSKPGNFVLDVGVGLGRLLSQFPDLRKWGMDIDIELLKTSQSKGIDVCYALIEDMPYYPETFDLVVCTDVLEHVIDLNKSCEKILSVLKKGGFLIVRTPYKEDLSQYLAQDYPYKFAHLRTFDVPTFELFFSRIQKGCRITQLLFAGYSYDNYKLKCMPFPFHVFIVRNILKMIKIIHRRTYNQLLQRWLLPIEINVVIQKIET